MIAPFIMEIRSKGSLIEFPGATGYFVSSLTFSLTDSLLGGGQKERKEREKAGRREEGEKKYKGERRPPVIRARGSFLDSNDSYRSQKQD